MTDRGQPGAQGSTLRNIEAGEASQTLSDGFIVPSTETTLSSQRYADLDESQYAEFDASYSSSSLDVTIEAGEAFIKGWLARDTQTTVTLTDFTDNQTVVLAWDADSVYDDSIHNSREDADSVIITLESDLPTLEVPYIPIWEFDTDGTGVTDARDRRTIGKTIQETQVGALEAADGDRVDMQSDSFENAGHDEVDVPQVQNLTVEDWESGVLSSAWDTLEGTVNVQSTDTNEGSYALEAQTETSTDSIIESNSGLSAYPQQGDEISYSVKMSNSNDRVYLYFGTQESGSTNPVSYTVYINLNGSYVTLFRRDDSEFVTLSNILVEPSEYVDSWVDVSISWGVDGDITVQLNTSSSVDELSATDDSIISGGIALRSSNGESQSTIYWDSIDVDRRSSEYFSKTEKGTTEIGNEATPSGAVHTGPRELSENATRGEVATAPVTDQATQGEQSLLTLLRSGISPAAYVERTMDGQGGAYGHQIQGALGRFARINSNLSWEYDTLADTPNWDTQSNGSSFSFGLVDRPRRIQISTDGSGSGVNGQIGSSQLVTFESIGAFRMTFKDVTYTANGEQLVYFGLSDQDFNDGAPSLGQSGNKMYFYLDTTTLNGEVVESGTRENKFIGDYDSGQNDFTIEYDGTEVRFYVDGVQEQSASFSVNADFKPFIAIRDSGSSSISDTFEASQVTVEPLPEVLQ